MVSIRRALQRWSRPLLVFVRGRFFNLPPASPSSSRHSSTESSRRSSPRSSPRALPDAPTRPHRLRPPTARQPPPNVPIAHASSVLKRLLDRRARLNKNDLWNLDELETVLKKRDKHFATISFDLKKSQRLTGIDINELRERDELWKETRKKQEGYKKENEDAKLNYTIDLQSQHNDERIYFNTLKRCLERGKNHPQFGSLERCKFSLDLLNESWIADLDLMTQKQSLSELQINLRVIREEARNTLRQAGLDHYETEVRDLKAQIQQTNDAIVETRRKQIANLGAFYTAAEADLAELQNIDRSVACFGTLKPKGSMGKLALLRNDYQAHFNKMKTSRETFENYRHTYLPGLEAACAAPSLGNPNKTQSEVVEQFTAEWIGGWSKVAQNLHEDEQKFLTCQEVAMDTGCQPLQIPVKVFGSDNLWYFDNDHPDDGQVSTEGTERRRRGDEKDLRRKPIIEGWLENMVGSTDTGAPQGGVVPDDNSVSDSLSDHGSGSLAPWDSSSLRDRNPRRRDKIDQYRIAMDEARYHRG